MNTRALSAAEVWCLVTGVSGFHLEHLPPAFLFIFLGDLFDTRCAAAALALAVAVAVAVAWRLEGEPTCTVSLLSRGITGHTLALHVLTCRGEAQSVVQDMLFFFPSSHVCTGVFMPFHVIFAHIVQTGIRISFKLKGDWLKLNLVSIDSPYLIC